MFFDRDLEKSGKNNVLKIIEKKIRRFGLQAADRDDLLQEIAIQVMKSEYDPDRSGGATEETYISAIVENRVKMFFRSRGRYQQMLDGVRDTTQEQVYETTPYIWSEQVESVLIDLSPEDRAICLALAAGQTQSEVAEERQCHRSSIRRVVHRVRKMMEQIGVQA